MATNDYWNYYDTSSSNWGSSNATNTRANYDTSTTGCGWTGSTYYYPVVVVKKILVHHPEIWTKEQSLKFVELINIKTKTGYIVELLIEGNVLITDPDIEKRDMKDFVPLLRKTSATDPQIINEFFEENPCLPCE